MKNIECVKVSNLGLGIGYIDNKKVFVENLLAGEVANIKIVQEKSKYNIGEVTNYITKSEKRIKPKCKSFDECGGCSVSHMNQELVKELKTNIVKFAFRNKSYEIIDCIDNEVLYGYRNKVTLHFGYSNSKIVSCMYQKNSNNIVLDSECEMLNKIGKEVNKKFVEYINSIEIEVYDSNDKTGEIESVIYQKGLDDSYLITIKAHNDYKNIITKFKAFSNSNVVGVNLLVDNKLFNISGEEFIMNNIGEFMFKINAKTFFQINSEVTIKMYDKLVDIANFKSTDKVIDAYCGIGTIGTYISKYVKSVAGIDIVSESIDNANECLKINKISNMSLYQGDVKDIVKTLDTKYNKIVIDPPRNGCDLELLEFIASQDFETIIYMSCNPTTLARDISILEDSGYVCKTIYVYDMFCQTLHVEAITVLEKKM